MQVSFISFAFTMGIGLPVLAFIWWRVRKGLPFEYMHLIVAGLIAFSVTPTVWAPFREYYIESASIVLFCSLIGLCGYHGFIFGGIPLLIVTLLLFRYFRYHHRMNQQSEVAKET